MNERVRAWKQANRERYLAYLHDYMQRNREVLNAKRRARRDARRDHLADRYGLTPDQVQTWVDFQQGNCALCERPLRKRFHVDHDHQTGIIRGMLHARCNQFLWTSPNYARYVAGWV